MMMVGGATADAAVWLMAAQASIIDQVSGPWVGVGVGAGVVSLGILAGRLLLTGRLVPASQVERVERLYVARADEWRAAWEAEHQRSETRDQQIAELLELARAGARSWESLRAMARPPGREGSP